MVAPVHSFAQDFDAGLVAYEAGEYATALGEWMPLARQGEAQSQFYLGVMYANGFGVTRDDLKAVRWYRLAAKQGYAEAQNHLGGMYFSGRGVLEDYMMAQAVSANRVGSHFVLMHQ